MQSGTKSLPDIEKELRGTLRKSRVRDTIPVMDENAKPFFPDFLTEEGKEFWLDVAERINGLNEIDSVLFGHYCNLAAAVAYAWRSGEIPPINYSIELRRLSELFGIAGQKSRVGAPVRAQGQENPFKRFKREPSDGGAV